MIQLIYYVILDVWVSNWLSKGLWQRRCYVLHLAGLVILDILTQSALLPNFELFHMIRVLSLRYLDSVELSQRTAKYIFGVVVALISFGNIEVHDLKLFALNSELHWIVRLVYEHLHLALVSIWLFSWLIKLSILYFVWIFSCFKIFIVIIV